MTLTAIIVTWRRPSYLRSTLEHLRDQTRSVEQILVVVAPDDESVQVIDSFPEVTAVGWARVAGHRTEAKNEALKRADGDVIAFLDDDAYPRASWCENLMRAFTDETIAALAGRTLNGQPGEEELGDGVVGRVLADGELTENFAADTVERVDVDHGIGANMAFRRTVLAELGGFRPDFPGTAMREETDMFLRIRARHQRVVFDPAVVVDHVGAPHIQGRRFDFRYQFWRRRNHVLLLARNFGLGSSQLRFWVSSELRHPYVGDGSRLRRALRVGLAYVGVGAGLMASARKAHWGPSAPERRDADGEAVRVALERDSS